MHPLLTKPLLEELDRYLARAVGEPPDPAALADYIRDQSQRSFRDRIFDAIRRSGLADVDVYSRAGISKSTFSRIRSGDRPAKDVAIALAFVLGLSAAQTEALLGSAGYYLSKSSVGDLIVRFFLERGVHDILAVNDALYAHHQPLLAGVRA
ncbi:MAG: hypothetical protein IJV65_01740 [Kiritimatiellae bacterium]|nr:hypothetical protein [Kiritimatiellia bacterium]